MNSTSSFIPVKEFLPCFQSNICNQGTKQRPIKNNDMKDFSENTEGSDIMGVID